MRKTIDKTKDKVINKSREQILKDKRKLKAKYGNLFDSISKILFQYDPMGINFETNTDEYEPEVRTILPKLKNCSFSLDVRRVIYQEFVRWFGLTSVKKEEQFEEIAQRVWVLWQKYQ